MNNWLVRNRGHLIVLLANLIVTGLAVLWLRQPVGGAVEVRIPTPVLPAAPTSPATPAPIAVYVHGAVAYADVYLLPAGSRVEQAIEAAGGFGPEADRDALNLAAALVDGAQVYVARAGEVGPAPAAAPMFTPPAQRIVLPGQTNINTASQAELEALPGIGPALAGRILEDRAANGPFQTVEDIKRVRGIGDALYEKIRELISVR